MSTPHSPEPSPPQDAKSTTQPQRPEDWILTRASPILGLAIVAGFSVGILGGIVKDVPPGLAGLVTVLIGARVVGRLKG